MPALAILAGTMVLYGLISRPLERIGATAPIAFVAVGLVAHVAGLGGLIELRTASHEAVRVSSDVALTVAELALALTLFTDAARVDLQSLRRELPIPARLLAIGMPLTVLLGLLAAMALFSGHLGFWEAAIVAVVLAPTDAALGAPVVEDTRLPRPLRQALTVESGLNDGLAVPALYLFLALADVTQNVKTPAYWTGFALREIGLGVLIGTVIAYTASKLFTAATHRGWVTGLFAAIIPAAIAITTFVIADECGASGFIAAFVGGLVAGAVVPDRNQLTGFIHQQAQFLAYAVFFFFGGICATLAPHLTGPIVLYAVLSLTIVRMLPVAIALAGSRLQPTTVAFVGWFGPRGLASIILAVVVIVSTAPALAGQNTMMLIIVATVFLSIVAHGITATPLSAKLARHIAQLPPDAAERS